MIAVPGIFIDLDHSLKERELLYPLFRLTRFGVSNCLAQLRGISLAQPGAVQGGWFEQ